MGMASITSTSILNRTLQRTVAFRLLLDLLLGEFQLLGSSLLDRSMDKN